ncbi:MAG: Spy/CpxP family protein refolding chaperone [Gemmatimonadota bacterium]
MKLIRFLAAAAIALTATTAMAQGGPPGGGQGGGQRQMEMMMKGITLTDAQKATVDSIVAVVRAESMKLREGMEPGTPPSTELRAQMTAVTAKRNEAIKAVLTAEQQAVFAKNLEEIAAMPRQRPPR